MHGNYRTKEGADYIIKNIKEEKNYVQEKINDGNSCNNHGDG